MLEILSERRLVGKIQLIGYLLHILARIAQKILGLLNHILVNPFGGGLSGSLLDNQREILRQVLAF